MVLRSLPSGVKYTSLGVAAIMLQACASMQSANSGDAEESVAYRDAIGVYSNPDAGGNMDPIAAAAFWGTRYNTNQSDPAAAVQFSQALRKIGSTKEATDVMLKASNLHPDDADVSLEYGKVLVENGRAFEAVRHLENAVTQKPADWNALSAYGVALDQIGEHGAARTKYDRALKSVPRSVSVLNNKGLSYAMDGKLQQARLTLQEAAANAGGDARVRQNLALVLALSGDMRGAERLARSDLPPQVANNNIDYFRQLMNQPAYWGEYVAADVQTPTFDDAPAAPLKGPMPEAPKPQLQETPKPQEEEEPNTAPIALIEATPLTNVSAPADDDAEEVKVTKE